MALVCVRRSWLAVVAVLGLVGSLLAVGVVPAAAVDGEADNEAVYSACVGPALESLGLVDVVGSFAEDAVNCLGHYGITKGRTATTYDPGAPVLRWQMALFLTRATGPAGVSLLADPADVFTDLEGVSDETRSAINQMAGLGIMSGRSGGRFSPDTAVSRAEMASMLDAFLVKARPGKGAFGGEAGVDELGDVTPDATGFNDIGSVTRGQYSAIERMFELGVTRGTSDNQFSPGGLVTRAQMAAFITRMLAHTVARPAGLTMQASALSVAGTADSLGDVDLVVSLRDSIHMAMADESVDVFSSSNAGDAFGSDGRCSVDEVLRLGDGTGVCEVEVSDGQTDSDGDVEITGQFGASATVWAWAGDVGDRFDADDTVWASLEITVTKPATKLRITDDMAVNATAVQFGDRVTFVVQVVDDDGNPVATKDVSVTVAANTTVASGAAGAGEQTSGVTNTHKTDDSGRIELSYRQTDPRTSGSDHGGDRAWLDLDITYSGTDYELEDKTTLKKAKDPDDAMVENAAVVWRDGTPVATTLTLAQAVSFHEASGSGSGASNTVTATLVDQYGDPVARQKVEFTSDDADGIGAKAAAAGAPAVLVFDTSSGGTRLFGDADALLTRTTNRRGVASLTYNRDSADGGIETILAEVKIGSGATAKTIEAERAYHYWAEEPGVGDSASGRLMASDTDNNLLVLTGVGVWLVKYDSNDHFTTPDGAATLSAFETDLRDNAKHASVSNYQTASKNVSRFTTGHAWATLDNPGGQAAIEADSRFGQAFAVDNGVIVVGASYEAIDHDDDDNPSTPTVSLSRAGAVYVYESITDTKPTKLVSATPVASAYFGWDVDISGDTIVVGAPGPMNLPEADRGPGNAYIFTKPSGGWGDDNTIDTDADDVHTLAGRPGAWDSSPVGRSGSKLGMGVAVSGDEETVAVVAAHNDGPGWQRGRVYVFEKPSGGWADIADVADATNGADAELTNNYRYLQYYNDRSVAISENGSVIVAGSEAWRSPGPGPGAVLVYVKPGAAWVDGVQTAHLSAPIKQGETHNIRQAMGKYVAVSSDGLTVVTSGHYAHTDTDDHGVTYVFSVDALTGWAALPAPSRLNLETAGDLTDMISSPQTSEPTATLSVAGAWYGDVVGQYIAIKSDGSEIAASRHFRQDGDWRGSVVTYTKLKGASAVWADDSSPDNEYLGVAPSNRLGWQVTYDKSNGDLFSGMRQEIPIGDDDYKLMTIFRIDR